MLFAKEKINAQLLFAMSFGITALAIYLFKKDSFGGVIVLHHNFILNVLFINITFLGSGMFCVSLMLYLFYRKKNIIGWLIIYSAFISTLIIQAMKIYLHKDGLQFFFEDEQYIFNAASQNKLTIFPSGHTAIAFSLATILVIHFNNRRSLFLFIIAGIVAYSRIYLGHHTLPDLFTGASIGLLSGSLCAYCYLNYIKLKNGGDSIRQKINNHPFWINNFSIE